MTRPAPSAASASPALHVQTPIPRLAVIGLVVVVLSATMVFAGVPSRAGAADRPAASASSSWLAGQLDDGTYRNPLASSPDYGLMLDAVIAMYASGDGHLAEPILEVLDDDGQVLNFISYAAWLDGGDADRIGGATAKTLVVALVSNRDPRNFGGLDLVAETRSVITPEGPEAGRVRDFGPHISNNSANTFGQTMAVIAFAGLGENDWSVIDALLRQQCSEGYFRIFSSYNADQSPATCDQGKATGRSHPDGDTTGFALSALLAARQAGATGLDEPIDRTVRWLIGAQHSSGGWGGGVGTEAPNTNSTGLIVQALADATAPAEVIARGEAYLSSAQVTQAGDATNALGDEIGAIGYRPEEYLAARATGIVHIDTWIRASAQASLGLSQVSFYRLVTGQVTESPDPQPGPTTTTVPAAATVPTRQHPEPTGPSGPSGPASAGSQPLATDPGRSSAVVPVPVSPRAGAPGPTRGTSGSVVSPAEGRVEAASPTPTGRLAAHLAGQLVDGDHVEVEIDGERLVDYDATAELVLALHQLGEQPAAVDRATRFLLTESSIEAYAHGAPYEDEGAAYAEPLAKLLLVALFAVDADDDTSGPEDTAVLVDRLSGELAGLVTTGGELEDRGEHADLTRSVDRHGWVVLAGAAVGAPHAHDAAERMVRVQCDDGAFPSALTDIPCESGAPTHTAWAVQALNATHAEAGAAPTDQAPEGWSHERVAALVRAVDALQAAVGEDGHVTSDVGIDPVATSQVSAAMRSLGLDATSTRSGLEALIDSDGDAPDPLVDQELSISIALASGLGDSLLSAEGSPVTAAAGMALLESLDLADPQADAGPQAARSTPAPGNESSGGSTSRWWVLVLCVVLVGGAAAGGRALRVRATA